MRIGRAAEVRGYSRDYGTLNLLAGNDGTGRMRSHGADLKTITVDPGHRTSHHFHLGRESLFHVLRGELTLRCDFHGARVVVRAGDTVILGPGEDHQLLNETEAPSEILEIESPPHESSDKIAVDSPHPRCRRAPGRFWEAGGRLRVKICGTKSLDACLACHEAGAHAVGLHAVGDRWTTILPALSWGCAIPEELSVFLLTDITQPRVVMELLDRLGCDTLQLQGRMSPDTVRVIAALARSHGYKVVKSVAAPTADGFEDTIRYCREFLDVLDAILVDSAWCGGTGRSPDWRMVTELAACLRVPLVAAGGIGRGNVETVVEALHPLGIDVESSVERRFSCGSRSISAKSPAEISELMRLVGSW